MALPVKRKAMAYITHGNRLLIFRQPDFPEAGFQVPGGSVHDAEHPEDAVLREAFEETGLVRLTMIGFLGDVQHDWSTRGRYEIHHRYYYHLRVDGDVPITWKQVERDPSEGNLESIVFEFFWACLPDDVPSLNAHMGEKIPELVMNLCHQ